MTLSESARELLDLLGLSDGPPSPRAFEDLFLRFQARVPYESLSRARRGGALAAEELFAALVEDGGGSAGSERARAFAALAEGLGYDVRLVSGEATGGAEDAARPHLAVLARIGSDEVLADAAYPMPVLLPLTPPASEVPTPYGKATVRHDAGTIAIDLEGHGELATRIRLSLDAGTATEPRDPPPLLVRALDDRVLRLAGGALEVDDPWSRLRAPYDASNGDPLRTLFAREDLTEEELAALPAAEAGPARLTVFDRSELPAELVRARLRSPEGLLALQPPDTRAEEVERTADGWRWRLVEDGGGAPRAETAKVTPDGLRVVPQDGALAERVYAVTETPSGTRLSLAATLAREVPPLGLGESVRKTLVFHLASELLALGRAGA